MDDDGTVYLVHAFAGSRAGIKSILVIKKMNAEGTKTIDNGVLVYDGHKTDPTIEGPKIYKRNKYYYIFAPAGGVSTGWQVVLRSKNIYGPYQRKVVMDGDSSNVNGPHQGAWVTTQTGEDWFLHFQDKKAYGRVVHLQPMKWTDDWPVIGADDDGDGKGMPVWKHKKPDVGKSFAIETPVESDEFNTNSLGLQWQWQANPKTSWSFLTGTTLRLYAQQMPDSAKNLWDVPNVLLQKFPAEKFTVTAKCKFIPRTVGEQFSFVIMGTDYAGLSIIKKPDTTYLMLTSCRGADKGLMETNRFVMPVAAPDIFFRVKVTNSCMFSFSFDDQHYTDFYDQPFIAKPGRWIGAKFGFSCIRTTKTNDSGYADIDWIRIDLADIDRISMGE